MVGGWWGGGCMTLSILETVSLKFINIALLPTIQGLKFIQSTRGLLSTNNREMYSHYLSNDS